MGGDKGKGDKGKGDKGKDAAPVQRKFDDETEAKLDKWEEAKRNRDFVASDAIRDELRAQGVDPDVERGKGKGKGKAENKDGGDWTCPQCGVSVFASKDECFKCHT